MATHPQSIQIVEPIPEHSSELSTKIVICPSNTLPQQSTDLLSHLGNLSFTPEILTIHEALLQQAKIQTSTYPEVSTQILNVRPEKCNPLLAPTRRLRPTSVLISGTHLHSMDRA